MSNEIEIPTAISLQIATKYYLAIQRMLRRITDESTLDPEERYIRDQLLDFTPMTPEQVRESVAPQIQGDLSNRPLLDWLSELDGLNLKHEEFQN
jgi:hypothetical protein